jgi:hypothetical protein
MVGGGAGALGGAMAGKGKDKAHREAMDIAKEGNYNEVGLGGEDWLTNFTRGAEGAVDRFIAGGGYQDPAAGRGSGGGGGGGGRGRGRGGGSLVDQGKGMAGKLGDAAGQYAQGNQDIFQGEFGQGIRDGIMNAGTTTNQNLQGAYDASANYTKDPRYDDLANRLKGGAAFEDEFSTRALEGILGKYEGGGGKGGAGMGGGFGGGGGPGGGPGSANLGQVTNEYMRKELEGDYMSEGNARNKALFEDMDREGAEDMQRALSQVARQTAGSGRMGSVGAGRAASLTAEEGMEAQMAQKNAMRKGLFDSERDRMSQAVGQLNALDQSRLAAAASGAASGASAAASRYGADKMAASQDLGTMATLFGNLTGQRQQGREFGLGGEKAIYDTGSELDMRNIDRMGNLGVADQELRNAALGLGNDSVANEASGLGNVATGALSGKSNLGAQGLASEGQVKSARASARPGMMMAQQQQDAMNRMNGIIDAMGPEGQALQALIPMMNKELYQPWAKEHNNDALAQLAASGSGGKGMMQGMMQGGMGGAMVGSGMPPGGGKGGGKGGGGLAQMNPMQIAQTPINQDMVAQMMAIAKGQGTA